MMPAMEETILDHSAAHPVRQMARVDAAGAQVRVDCRDRSGAASRSCASPVGALLGAALGWRDPALAVAAAVLCGLWAVPVGM